VRGDANTFGVVYRSTAGRGIAARFPALNVGITHGLPYAIRRSPPLQADGCGVVRIFTLDGRLIAKHLQAALIENGTHPSLNNRFPAGLRIYETRIQSGSTAQKTINPSRR